MFFSIIIPAYNAEKTMARCLESVIKQSFQDFEAIIVDDGSKDNTEAICDVLCAEDQRLRYVRQENAGPSAARNHGIDIARGEYVVFLDSDDCYDPSYLDTFYRAIQKNPEVAHFWCGFTTVSDDPRENGTGATLINAEAESIFDRREIMSLHARMFLASLCNKAFMAKVLKNSAIRMEQELSLGEDLLFNLAYLDACENTKILVINEPKYIYYCFSSESLNHRYRPDLEAIYAKLRQRIFQCLTKWQVSDEEMKQYYSMSFYMLDRVIRNYQHPECQLPKKECAASIKRIMRSQEFIIALKKGDAVKHPLFKLAYLSGNYYPVMLLERLASLKKKYFSRR